MPSSCVSERGCPLPTMGFGCVDMALITTRLPAMPSMFVVRTMKEWDYTELSTHNSTNSFERVRILNLFPDSHKLDEEETAGRGRRRIKGRARRMRGMDGSEVEGYMWQRD